MSDEIPFFGHNIVPGTGGTSNGANNIYITYPPAPIDTDLRIRVLGLATQQSVGTGGQDPVALAERMLAFVEGRSDAPDSDCVTMPDGSCVADVCKLHDPVDTDEFDEDEAEEAFNDWYAEIGRLLGKEVRVTLGADTDSKSVVCEGILLGFGEGGDFEILEDDGFIHYCWPMLDITLIEDPDDV